VIDQTVVRLEDAVDDAMENRPELARLKLAREINQLDLKLYKNQTRPQVDVNTTFSLDGLARGGTNESFTTDYFTRAQDISLFEAINQTRVDLGLPIITAPPPVIIPAGASYLYGGFNRSMANMFRSDAPNFTIGVTISFPFGNRTAKANLAGAKIREEQLAAQTRDQEQTVLVDVRNAVQAVETARQRVFAARRARENAQIQLDGERKLFDSGRSNTFLLFQRENALANARNAEISAETDYSKAVSDLQRVTSTTFEANNIVVESPTDH
jgi:HAE1 family hydrophobic/amphiphilic exporter-1